MVRSIEKTAYRRERGRTRRLGFGWQLLLLLGLVALACTGFRTAYRSFYRKAYPLDYGELVLESSQDFQLPPSLIYAVIRTESGFNPRAESSVPARGLMQITPETFEWAQYRLSDQDEMPFERLFDPVVNVWYGSGILRLHLDEFGTVENALCAYHAGPGNARLWLEDPKLAPDGENIEHIPFGDTGRYVRKVLETQEMYRRLYDMA